MTELSTTATRVPHSGIREILALASATPGVIHLEIGEPDFDTPAHIVEAAARAAAEGYTHYTPNAGIPEVRETFANKVAVHNGISATPENVVMTVGGGNALYLSTVVLCDPGDGILIPDPAWPNYEIIAKVVGARPVRYPLDPSAGFVPDWEALEATAATPGAKALIMNTPANPTGAVFDRGVQERFLEVAERHDLWLISDEAYEDIVFEGPHISPASITDSAERVISAFTLSKSYAMTGWRVGYAVVPVGVAEAMAKLMEPINACVPGITQKAAQAAVAGDQSSVEEMRVAYQRRRDLASERLEEAGMLVNRPHGSFYIMVDASGAERDGYDLCRSLVTEHGVAATPGETFGDTSRGMVRLSLAASDDDLSKGVDRVIAALSDG